MIIKRPIVGGRAPLSSTQTYEQLKYTVDKMYFNVRRMTVDVDEALKYMLEYNTLFREFYKAEGWTLEYVYKFPGDRAEMGIGKFVFKRG